MRLQDASIACTICAHDFFFFSNSIPASVRVRDSPNAPDVWLEPSVVWVCSLLLLYCCFTAALLRKFPNAPDVWLESQHYLN